MVLRVVSVIQNSKIASCEAKTMSLQMLTPSPSIEVQGTAEFGVNSLLVHQYK